MRRLSSTCVTLPFQCRKKPKKNGRLVAPRANRKRIFKLMRFWKVRGVRDAIPFVSLLGLRSIAEASVAQWDAGERTRQGKHITVWNEVPIKCWAQVASLSPLTNNKWSAIYHPGAMGDALASHIKLFSPFRLRNARLLALTPLRTAAATTTVVFAVAVARNRLGWGGI